MENILCGSKCVMWMLQELGFSSNNVTKDLYFVTDIANEFVKNGINPIVYCYNSNLYNDYKSNTLNIEQAIKSISNFELISKIMEKPFNINDLIFELEENYIILNVDSRIINKTKKNTGHYIILKKEKDNIMVINPEKTRFTEKIYSAEKIIEMCKNNGNWRIEIRRKK